MVEYGRDGIECAHGAVPRLGLAIVELENGVKATGQLKTESPKIGMKIKGRIEIIRDEGFVERDGIVFY
ncbi:MAG: hypothetical protein MUO43_18730 [Desulfobacterales bacterium]|nr:hypothetical protein [Desulfobacterales bacterium]